MQDQINLDWDTRFLAPIDVQLQNEQHHPLSPHSAPLANKKYGSNADIAEYADLQAPMSRQDMFLQSPVSNYNDSPPLQLAELNGQNDMHEIPMPLHFGGGPSFSMDNSEQQMSNVYQMMDAEGNVQWVNAEFNPMQMNNLSPAMQRVQHQLRHSNSETSLSSWTSQQSFSNNTNGTNNNQWGSNGNLQQFEPGQIFSCTFPGCTKQFNKPTNLKSHARIHNTERSFVCTDCGSAFRRSHDLKRHQRSLHTDVKPFGCQRCGKRFSRMVNSTLIVGCTQKTFI